MPARELTVGVLGGMGPAATIDFLSQVLRLTDASKDQDHIHLVVDQNPKVPDRQLAIRREGPDAGPELAAMARRLEHGGADFLVMPCNSAHAFVDEIRRSIAIPFVSIVDVCIDEITRVSGGRSVGLLATDGLLETGIYQRALQAAGFEPLLPSAEQQARLMILIRAIKGGDQGGEVAREMAVLAESLVSRGATCVTAACTEIPLVLAADAVAVPLVSSTEVLAKRAVALALREMPLSPQGN